MKTTQSETPKNLDRLRVHPIDHSSRRSRLILLGFSVIICVSTNLRVDAQNFRLWAPATGGIQSTNSWGPNVGIGTNAPKEKLHVEGNMLLTGETKVKKADGTIVGIGAGRKATLYLGDKNSWIQGVVGNGVAGGGVSIGGIGAPYGALFVDAYTGNVGIGNNGPRYRLHVVGKTSLEGDAYIGGNFFLKSTRSYSSWPVGITQAHVGGGYSMELTTSDDSGDQATRFLLRGGNDFADAEFYSGSRDQESLNMIVKGESGNVGIGTENPQTKLHVNGQVKLGADAGTDAVYVDEHANLGVGTIPTKGKLHVKGSIHVENHMGDQVFHVSQGHNLTFIGKEAWDHYNEANQEGTTLSSQENFSLWVSEGIVAEDLVFADVSKWSDYVFEDDYDLASLDKVESFIRENGHLPNIPSQQEVFENGYDVQSMQAKFLEKIEELTLYTISQERQILEIQRKHQEQIELLLQRVHALEQKSVK